MLNKSNLITQAYIMLTVAGSEKMSFLKLYATLFSACSGNFLQLPRTTHFVHSCAYIAGSRMDWDSQNGSSVEEGKYKVPRDAMRASKKSPRRTRGEGSRLAVPWDDTDTRSISGPITVHFKVRTPRFVIWGREN